MAVSQNRIKHLELIQGVINRLAGNSFSMKGWSIAVVTGAIALLGGQGAPFVGLAFAPAVVFWALDAYYLWQEQLFRDLYNAASTIDENDDATASIELFSMTPRPVPGQRSWWNAAKSPTILPLHLAIVLMVLTAAVITHYLTPGAK